MLIKTLLNRVEKFKSFVYGKARLQVLEGIESLVIAVRARRNSRPLCPLCIRKRSIYDTLQHRLYEYVPLWGFKMFFRYAARRVNCPIDGVKVELLPWVTGKDHQTTTLNIFLATWARRLSWKEVAQIFRTSWDSVFHAVSYVVQYGLTHRNLDGIRQIGVDEIQIFHYHKYLTLVYQIDDYQKSLRFPHRQRPANRALSHTWQPTRTKINPQILLKTQFFLTSILQLIYCKTDGQKKGFDT